VSAGTGAASFRKGAALVTLMLASLALTACDGPRGMVAEADAVALKFDAGAYRLAPGDKLKVTVFNEPDLTGEFQVNDTGNVAFPLAGSIKAAGASINEFQEQMTKHLRGRYVRNPKVSVEVVNYRPFNVIGEVRNAGQYPYRPGLTVQDAVAMAGGFTYRANTRTIYVRRSEAGGEITVSPDGERVAVMPGDNVRVPERYF
jgi:polysaccharide biosynthesis/export protein